MCEMEERLFQEYVGKELIEFLIKECEDNIGNRKVWICIGTGYNVIFQNTSFIVLLHLGSKIKTSLIEDIKCFDKHDLTIYIENPFKGVD